MNQVISREINQIFAKYVVNCRRYIKISSSSIEGSKVELTDSLLNDGGALFAYKIDPELGTIVEKLRKEVCDSKSGI